MRHSKLLRCAITSVGIFAAASQAFAGAADAADPVRDWLTPALTYDGALVSDLQGGLRRGSTYVGNLHLKLTAKGASTPWLGTTGFVDLLAIHGGRPSQLVGDAQGVSNIEGPAGSQIEELWLQHNFQGSSVSVLGGIYDLNSEFYRLQAAGLFLNSSFGMGPEFAQSGVEGPSIFPRTSAGIRFALKPGPGTVLRAALLDGVPVARPDGSHAVFQKGDGLLGVAEVAFLSRASAADTVPRDARDRIGRFSALRPYDDKLALGLWHYSGRYADLSDVDSAANPVARRGTSGAYAIGERELVGRDGSSRRHLAAFGQIGVADARTNRFASYVGAGLVGSGWGVGREADQIGISIARANNGSHYARSMQAQDLTPTRAETTIEVTYLAQVSKHLAIQPDIQYVVHPNTDPSVSNAWVLQLRFECSF